jgi:hypothetical protein
VPKPITADEIRAAVAPCSAWLEGTETEPPDRRTLGTAVRVTLRAFAQAHPGKAVEVRVPPFAAVQCLSGGAHTRGTPPHVVETDPRTWLLLATGRSDWTAERGTPHLQASGHRADEVGALLPIPAATIRANTPE